MALDSHYVLAFTFEKYFVDKDTGLPLSNGYINFFRDTARSTPKDMYILSGSPPNYTYTNIGSTVNLTGYGVPEYTNNNIALYFLPYTLDDNDDPTNTIDLYYYEVYSEDDVLQFTREGQPNVFAESTEETINNNYVPNGQFLWHNEVPAAEVNDYVEGKITQLITEVAPGGWTFERTTNGTDNIVDIVTYERIASPSASNPEDNPRYKIILNCEDATGGGSYKDLRLKFDSVNKFQSYTTPEQQYTFTFSAKNNEDETINGVQVRLIKNYGTGGSVFTDDPIGTFDLTPTATQFAFTFDFGTSSGKTLSATHDDDYLQIAIRLSAGEEFNVAFTDFGLFTGDFADPEDHFSGTFAATTDNQMTYQALAGQITLTDYFETNAIDPTLEVKNPDLFLPTVKKLNGLDVDYSPIGRKEEFSNYNASDWDADSVHVSTNLIMPMGQQFATADYSPLHIPYSRLQSAYWIASLNLPRYGTGPNYMTVTIPAADNIMLASNNYEGAVTNAADVNTGFTITTIHKESALYYSTAYMSPTAATFIMEGKFVGAPTAQPAAGTTTFTFTNIQVGTTLLKNITSALAPAGSTLTNTGNPGKYFTFYTVDGSAVNHQWYVWFFVTNETDPAPGGTGIKITLTNPASADTAQIVAQKVQQALNGWQETTIATVAASSITGGDYFTINSAGTSPEDYYVWYKKDGAGTDPAPANKIGILVNILSADTAAQVATKTQIAMNMKNFALPDYRGKFFRVWDNGAGVDPDAASRYSLVPGVIGDTVGTLQNSENKSHTHGTNATEVVPGADLQGGANAVSEPAVIAYDGVQESRPINEYVNVAIRY